MSHATSSNAASVQSTERTHQAHDGCALHVYQWTSQQAETGSGAIVIVLHGYSEHCGRYREFAEFLVRTGHPVWGLDARGHGRSAGQRGDVLDYERYIDDLHGFAREIRQQHPGRRLVVLGHSNGGLTALRMVQSRAAVVDGLILTCPLIELQPSHQPMPLWLASIVAKLVARLPLPNGLKPHELTHDQAIVDIQQRDPLNHRFSTPRWYVTTMLAMQQAMASLDAVHVPVLVVGADSDPIVVPAAVRRMYEGLASQDKEFLLCSNAYHEVLNELDRDQTYRKIGAWLAARFS
jgi:acylglycerol lipase